MRRCRTCVIPDTRPDTHFDDTGQCSACTAYQRRPMVDWDARKAELVELLEKNRWRQRARPGYDCIVPSSGGKDSHYQVLTLLELGAKPLVVTASTCMLTDIGRRNIDNLARYAHTIEVTPRKDQRAKLNRLGLEMVGDVSWPEHVAIFTIPFQIAVNLCIPLMFYGENPQREYGGPPGTEKAREMTRRWVSEFGGFLGLRPSDMEPMAGDMSAYKPPSAMELAEVGVEAHFLGQYLPWDSHENARTAHAAGMEWGDTPPGQWPFENLDNAMTGLHDHAMYRKFGYGRLAAQLSVDVRTGRVSRDHAMEMVRECDGLFPFDYLGVPYKRVLERIGMSEEHLLDTLRQFTNSELFDGERNLRPILKETA